MAKLMLVYLRISLVNFHKIEAGTDLGSKVSGLDTVTMDLGRGTASNMPCDRTHNSLAVQSRMDLQQAPALPCDGQTPAEQVVLQAERTPTGSVHLGEAG